MNFIRIFFLFSLLNILLACSEQTIYSGKIINQDNLYNLNITNKDELFEIFGNPSFIDPIENKYFYYSEKIKEKNFFNKKIEYSYLFLFTLDKNEGVLSQKVYNLLETNDIKFAKDETQNNIIERGLLEKLFGGIGPQQLPNTP